jgi:hypothetical protein
MEPIVIDVARAVVVLVVVGGAGHVSGYLSGRRERQQTQRERVASRRARRMDELDLRHRVPNQPGDEDEQGTDTTVDVPVEEPTARRRFTGIAMPHVSIADRVRDATDPVGAIARRRTRLHMSTEASNRNARVILAQLDEGMDMQHAIYGDDLERPLLYEEIASEYPTAYYAIVTRPDQPQKPGDNQKPKLRKRKKHAHGGVR